MALKNKKEKTKFQSIYSLINSAGTTLFYAVIIRNNKRYGEKNMTKLFGCTTAKQASDKLNEIYAIIDRGEDPFNLRSDKLDDLFDKYSSAKNEPFKTQIIYRYNKWVKNAIGHKSISKIKVEDIEEIMNNVKKAGVQPSTELAIKDMLMPVFNREFELENINRNILKRLTIRVPKQKVILNSTLEEMIDTVKKIFSAVNNLTKMREGKNNKLLFILVMMTARRIGELIKLEYEDIDFDKKIIRPRPQTTKTLKDELYIYSYPIPDEALELLDRNGTGKIFGGSQPGYNQYYNAMINAAFKDKPHRLTPHINRHFFISIMSEYYDSRFIVKRGVKFCSFS